MALKDEFKSQGDFLFKNRSWLPILIILPGLYIYIMKAHEGTLPLGFDPQYYEWVCVAVALLGFLVRFIAIGYSDDNTSGRNTAEGQIADSVNTTGFYTMCRHPLYLGNFLIWVGIAAMTQDVWFTIAFTLAYWLYYERIMYAEETFLIGKYGKQYEDYSMGVNAFWPALGKWTKPKNAYSLVKIIRQEKAGILNLFLVLFLFKQLAHYAMTGELVILENFFTYAFAASIGWYIIIKLLQKTTSLLKEDR
jgi:protein-S-isoprenylcysteine O-methyltransferase Ste14